MLGILSVLILYASHAHGKIYKWVDENGRMHFSDKPPKGVKYELQNLDNMNVTSMPRPRNLQKEQDELAANKKCAKSGISQTSFKQQRKRLEQQYKNRQLSDEQFATELAKLEQNPSSSSTSSKKC